MRLHSLVLPVAVPVLLVLGAASVARRAPKAVTITAACNPSGNPDVQPQRRDMTRQDHVEWREPSGRATAWTITPKDPADWPFADTLRGDQETPAATALPAASAPADHPFGYQVRITCADGSTQTIDPDIVIGGN